MKQRELLDLLKEAAMSHCSASRRLEIMNIIAIACSTKSFGFEDKSAERMVSKTITNMAAKVYKDVLVVDMAYNLPHLFPFFALMCSDENEIDKNLLLST